MVCSTRCASRREVRSRYSVSAESASRPITGQRFTSDLEMKRQKRIAWMVGMSTQEMWLATSIRPSGPASAGVPRTCSVMPQRRTASAAQRCTVARRSASPRRGKRA